MKTMHRYLYRLFLIASLLSCWAAPATAQSPDSLFGSIEMRLVQIQYDLEMLRQIMDAPLVPPEEPPAEPPMVTVRWTLRSMQAYVDSLSALGQTEQAVQPFDPCLGGTHAYVDVDGFRWPTLTVGNWVEWNQPDDCDMEMGPDGWAQWITFRDGETHAFSFEPDEAFTDTLRIKGFKVRGPPNWCADPMDWADAPVPIDDSNAAWTWWHCTASGRGGYRALRIRLRGGSEAKSMPVLLENASIEGAFSAALTPPKRTEFHMRNVELRSLGYAINIGAGGLRIRGHNVYLGTSKPAIPDSISGKAARHLVYLGNDPDIIIYDLVVDCTDRPEAGKDNFCWRTAGESGSNTSSATRFYRATWTHRVQLSNATGAGFECYDCTYLDAHFEVPGAALFSGGEATSLVIDTDTYRTNADEQTITLENLVVTDSLGINISGGGPESGRVRHVNLINLQVGCFRLGRSLAGNDTVKGFSNTCVLKRQNNRGQWILERGVFARSAPGMVTVEDSRIVGDGSRQGVYRLRGEGISLVLRNATHTGSNHLFDGSGRFTVTASGSTYNGQPISDQ